MKKMLKSSNSFVISKIDKKCPLTAKKIAYMGANGICLTNYNEGILYGGYGNKKFTIHKKRNVLMLTMIENGCEDIVKEVWRISLTYYIKNFIKDDYKWSLKEYNISIKKFYNYTDDWIGHSCNPISPDVVDVLTYWFPIVWDLFAEENVIVYPYPIADNGGTVDKKEGDWSFLAIMAMNPLNNKHIEIEFNINKFFNISAYIADYKKEDAKIPEFIGHNNVLDFNEENLKIVYEWIIN